MEVVGFVGHVIENETFGGQEKKEVGGCGVWRYCEHHSLGQIPNKVFPTPKKPQPSSSNHAKSTILLFPTLSPSPASRILSSRCQKESSIQEDGGALLWFCTRKYRGRRTICLISFYVHHTCLIDFLSGLLDLSWHFEQSIHLL